MKEFLQHTLARVLACTVALSLGFGMVFSPLVYADETVAAQQAVDSALVALDGAEAHMTTIKAEREALQQEVTALDERIEVTLAQATEAQQAVIEGRAALGRTAVYEYRGGLKDSLFAVFLGAAYFSELLRNLTYFNVIMDYQAAEIVDQEERSARYDALVGDLNTQKNEQDQKLAKLDAKKAEAEQVVSSASVNFENAQDDQAARLAALKQMAEEMAASSGTAGPIIDPDANTVARPDPPAAPVQPDPAPPVPDPTPSPDPSPGANWSTGIASAYGGSTDASTPNPGITGSGAVCDDLSMGVAVPMSWNKYWQYYGRAVEISYGGTTVLATVNDCGYMGGGSRSLDLQPGVWKAFGFSSCRDWGLRSVSYRFL